MIPVLAGVVKNTRNVAGSNSFRDVMRFSKDIGLYVEKRRDNFELCGKLVCTVFYGRASIPEKL